MKSRKCLTVNSGFLAVLPLLPFLLAGASAQAMDCLCSAHDMSGQRAICSHISSIRCRQRGLTAIASRMDSERAFNSQEDQRSIGFQPVFCSQRFCRWYSFPSERMSWRRSSAPRGHRWETSKLQWPLGAPIGRWTGHLLRIRKNCPKYNCHQHRRSNKMCLSDCKSLPYDPHPSTKKGLCGLILRI
jgi:hypothetical protein